MPFGAAMVFGTMLLACFTQAELLKVSVFVSKLYLADKIGLKADVDWVAWLPESSRTEMLVIVAVPGLELNPLNQTIVPFANAWAINLQFPFPANV